MLRNNICITSLTSIFLSPGLSAVAARALSISSANANAKTTNQVGGKMQVLLGYNNLHYNNLCT